MILEKICKYRFFIFLLLLSPFFLFSINWYDEGIVLVNAQRVLEGAIPHVDFWSIYPLGQYWLYACYLMIFGKNLMALRCLEILFGGLLLELFYNITFAYSRRKSTAMGWSMALLLFLIQPELRFFPPIYPAVFLSLLVFSFLSRFLINSSKKNLCLALACELLCLFFRQDVFVYALLALVISILILRLNKSLSLKTIIRPVSIFSLMILAMVLALQHYNMLNLVVQQLFWDPLYIIPKYRNMGVDFMPCFYFAMAIGLLLLTLWQVIFKKNKIYHVLLYPALLCLLLCRQMFNRADPIHSMPVNIYLFLLLGFVCHQYKIFDQLTGRVKIFVGILSAYKSKNQAFKWLFNITLSISFVLLIFQMKKPALIFKNKIEAFNLAYCHQLSDWPMVTLEREQLELISYVKKVSKKNDHVYIGVNNHDRFTFNEEVLYFLIDRKIPTQYTELHPGIATTAHVQSKIKQELSDSKTKYMVLTDGYWPEDNDSKIDLKLDILDDFIQENYIEIYKNKTHRLLVLK
jgi:hypothetical protein